MKRWVFVLFVLLFASAALARPPQPPGAVREGEYFDGEKIYEYSADYVTAIYFLGFNKAQKWIQLFGLTSPDNKYEISRERTANWVPVNTATRIGGYWEKDLPNGIRLILFPKEGTRIEVWTTGAPMSLNRRRVLPNGDSENVRREKK